MIFEEYENILENNKSEIAFATKLFIVSELSEYDLSGIDKDKLLDYIYSYWVNYDFIENTLSDYIWVLMNNSELVERIKDGRIENYRDFENYLDNEVDF